MKLSKLVDRISGEGAAAWNIHTQAQHAAANGEDVIVLSIGDPDFPTPAPIIESGVAALRSGDTHYAAVPGRDKLRVAIANDFQNRTGVTTDAENVFVFAGTQNALFATSLILFDSDDEVIVLEPMYVTYEACLRIGGATMVPVAQPAENGFRPDIGLIKSAITDKSRAIVITTPNNPTGVVLSKEELSEIAALAIKHDLWVLSDEVYTDLIFEGNHISIASLPGMAERTVTVNSLSKSHAMTGWRTGWSIGPKALFPHYDNLGLCMLYGLPGFVQEAAYTALTEQRDASLAMRDIYQRRRDLVCAELAKAANLPVLKSQAAMYVMVDVRHYYDSAKDFAHALYHEKGVSVLDAGAFGKSAIGWIRLCFTLDEDSLVEGCKRIVDFLGQRQ